MFQTGAAKLMLSAVNLVEAMSSADFYPDRPARVEVRQTHISWVFLAGERVYKVKKPVTMAFLDYSTLEARRRCCDEEIRLNRRLAPTVYERVVAIRKAGGGLSLAGDGEIVEYAVVMRRLPDERMLDRLLANGRAGANEIATIAARMVAFHGEQAVVRDPAIGSPAAIQEIAHENLEEAAPFRDRTVSSRRFEALSAFAHDFGTAHEETFAARLRDGRLRDCHGDLRAEHVCLEANGELSIFDCVEFSARLRSADVASEIVFLAMDLDFWDEPALSRALVDAYVGGAGDPGVAVVEPFYRCYRAAVRGKVESLKANGPDVPRLEQRMAEERARRFFALASRYASAPVGPALVLVAGEIGSGKSTLARLIADRTGFALHSSDRTRKSLAGLAPTARVTGTAHARLYSEELTRRTYEALFASAARELRAGCGVVLDATFAERWHRASAPDVAARAGVPLVFVECVADESVIVRRLEERKERPDEASDATVEVYRARRGTFAPTADLRPAVVLRADTSDGPLAALDAVEDRLIGVRS